LESFPRPLAGFKKKRKGSMEMKGREGRRGEERGRDGTGRKEGNRD